ncbi:hypothetical protein FRC08_009688 [Ceratobasidium sp. 394]|nr:hypothetical protein FRC08_009688 [Ceratobasidium sp. 394]
MMSDRTYPPQVPPNSQDHDVGQADQASITDPDNFNGSHPLRDNGAGSSIPSKISRVMPLSSVVAILVEHECQDISKVLDLSACSEYPISSGGFGDVYRGQLKDGTAVAIKCMRIIIDPRSNEQQKHFKDAAREIHTWSKLNHRYVSRFLGLAEFRGQIAMVSPWAQHGSLSMFLANRPDLNRPRLCTQIAEGLAFLHQCNVVHGDLKGANVLVSEAYEPLLADFGSATLQERTLQFTCTTTRNNFSLRWTAPELLGDAPLSVAADVYALGMTILEVITGSVPYAEFKRDPAVMNAINNKQHPKRSQAHIPTGTEYGDVLWELLTSCWAFKPESRPSAQLVQDKLAVLSPKGLILQEMATEGEGNSTEYKCE